jgi:CheY-like chemotaxis protein
VLVADDDSQILRCYRRAFAEPPSTESEDVFEQLAGELFGSEGNRESSPVFDVVECAQGDQAVEIAEKAFGGESSFDVVVLDVRMPPGINGVEAGEQIRRLDPHVPIIFVSGYSDISSADLERRVPPPSRLYFYNKPLSFRALAQDIAEIVTRIRSG